MAGYSATLYAHLEKKELALPEPRLLPQSNNNLFETENIEIPFVFTAVSSRILYEALSTQKVD